MIFTSTNLPDVFIIEPEPQEDERGWLMRTYCEQEFKTAGLNTSWPQQNQTLTKGKGSVRGLHYQARPYPEIKLVRCLSGNVLDVAVDIRPESPRFGQWVSCELSEKNRRGIYIPDGFAHGFQCLSSECELLYLMSECYRPELARGIRWDDPDVGIKWPLPAVGLSLRDSKLPGLNGIESHP